MSGRPKQGIDYAGWDVTMFDNDRKMDKLLDAQGWLGFSIYFYICQKAYGDEGYFYRWSDDSDASIARKMGAGIRSGTVKATVEACLRCGLFDKRLYAQGVLTSRGMQKRYAIAIAKRRVRSAIREYWLLTPEESGSITLVPLSTVSPSANVYALAANTHLQAANDETQAANATKERKGNGTAAGIFYNIPSNPFGEDDGEENPVFVDNLLVYARNNLLYMTPNNESELLTFRDDDHLTDELIIHVIDEACGNGHRVYNYVKSILNRCVDENVRTVAEFKAASEAHARKKGGRRNADAGRAGDSGPRKLFEGQTIV